MTPNTSPARLLHGLAWAACLALLAAAAGCSHPQTDELTKGVVAGAKQIAMAGTDTFFDGKVTASVTLSRGIGKGLSPGAARGRGDTNHDEQDRKTYHDYAEADNKQLLGSPLPPVTLHLVLTNTGPDPITVDIHDFESELGNFALDPETLTIPPGQSAEPTAMVSYLGVSSSQITFKVSLSVAELRETRVIVVKDVLDPESAPSTATSTAPAQ